MKRLRRVSFVLGILLGGCVSAPDQPASQELEAYRRQSAPLACRRIASSTPDDAPLRLTFRRSHGGDRGSSIEVFLAWQRDPAPLYTPRGPMRVICLSEADRVMEVPLSAVRSEPSRTLEDLWPEDVQLVSSRPGDYDLLLPNGVPAGSHATLATIRRGVFRSAIDLESEPLRPVPAHLSRSEKWQRATCRQTVATRGHRSS